MMDPAFGYERLTRITSGARTSCMSEPMTEGPFDWGLYTKVAKRGTIGGRGNDQGTTDHIWSE